jgi:hypothetical protein
MLNELTVRNEMDAQLAESVLLGGDLSKLTPAQRVNYYQRVCNSLGLNPLTKPFDYINLNGKLTLYAKKDAADQLRKINGVSIDDVDIIETEKQFIVKVKGHDASGRADVEVGVVNKTDMRGDTANAQMKAVTKGKRRLTLSLCGLGWLDETEVQTIPDARHVAVAETGEIIDGHASAPETINQETGQPEEPVELIKPHGDWAVSYAAGKWNCDNGHAAQDLWKKITSDKPMDKRDFLKIVNGE